MKNGLDATNETDQREIDAMAEDAEREMGDER